MDKVGKLKLPKTVAVFGGSFDPPTLAHVQVASEIYNTHEDIDAVWLIPCGDGRCDKNMRTEGEHRIKMVDLILKDIIGDIAPIKVN
jgi:nicotinate-nucleotide adenylyltransferase